MPRKPREKSKTGIYHIILRGINRQNIFEDDEDKLELLDTIKHFKEKSGYDVYGYCLMSNHIHLLLKETEESISNIIKRVCGRYVYWYNNKYERVGHLFQERFKSEVVEDQQYLLINLRYIHQNPVKAGLTNDLSNFYWSSYREYMRERQLIDVKPILGLFSHEEAKALNMFKEYTNQSNHDKCLDLQEKIQVADQDIISYLSELEISCISQFQQLEKNKRNEILKKLKNLEGVTTRQLSSRQGDRLTVPK
ncbi:transposase [Alkaliphilus hydrothermalis]|uniref:REP element-mobilizing transposase RayT n=1 Tax=Alkaliphilus hydrothermalis TaxID=1482730 RepID=A0ABS2NQ26_9FIRM|nr:transposase [Alkaliphilus hydrothermalis]MBM7615040.1 REP element-mobilizing transposase RayT [Alkaliphilus hydrothermalis]